MSKALRILFAVLLATSFSRIAVAQNPVVVVELFTSEGCSSCPPADAALMELSQQGGQNGTQLILLGEHVDYWNYIGWTDRFSSAQFSDRQAAYAKALHSSVYTPQMVVDGGLQFVGGDAAEVRRKADSAAKAPKPAQVKLAWEGGQHLRINVTSAKAAKAEVLLAITEDGLTTSVGAGENGGRTLHHAAVVRQLRPVGELSGTEFGAAVDVALSPQWNARNVKVAVLVQDPDSRRILGAAGLPYSH